MSDNLQPYPDYKESGVSWFRQIPAHWGIHPGLAAYRPKQHKNTGMLETTVLSLSYGQIVIKPPEKLHGLVPESFETYQIVDPGDIIIRPTDLQNDWLSLRVGLSKQRGSLRGVRQKRRARRRVRQNQPSRHHGKPVLPALYGDV